MDPLIAGLRKRQIYIGTSSWKYEGWKGSVYQRPYRSDKQFNEECLEEFAEHYSAVGVDHTFYAWPTQKGFAKYLAQTPPEFKFGLKVTEEITIWQYPKLKRYGKKAGLTNEAFLSPSLFRDKFLSVIAPFREKIGPVMLEFSQFYPGMISSGSEFTERLDKFFSEIPEIKDFQLAVEIRNAGWLKPPYFQMLQSHGVSHVFNSWTRMPTLEDQLSVTKDFRFKCYPARLLLRPGMKYEAAVEAYSPYDKIQDEQPETRNAAASLIERALEMGVPAFVFVNNRCEGSAPLTIDGILEILRQRKIKYAD